MHRFAGHPETIFALAWSPDGTRLASASHDTTLLIWAVRRAPDEKPLRLELSELQACWTALAGGDAAKAHGAINTLSRGAQDSVPFLTQRLQPVPDADPKRLSRLLADLENDEFSTRQMARAELQKLGELAEPALRRALANPPSAESRRRLEELVGELEGWSGERLRALRAIMVLENVGSAEASQVLESLAKRTPETRLTREAKAALARLTKRLATVH
jgi:hypothetical protein